jgi:hypothetical protein
MEENKALIRRWFEEVWNQGRADAIAEMMSEDCINHGLSETDEPCAERRVFCRFIRSSAKPFPTFG